MDCLTRAGRRRVSGMCQQHPERATRNARVMRPASASNHVTGIPGMNQNGQHSSDEVRCVMQVIAIPSSRPGRHEELQQFERLAARLSSQFARLHVEEIASAIAGALEQVGAAISVDAAALIEFSEGEAVSAVHMWPSAEAAFGAAGCPPRWLLERLAQREVVLIAGREDVPAGDAKRPVIGRTGRGWACRSSWRSRSSARWCSGRAGRLADGRSRSWNECG